MNENVSEGGSLQFHTKYYRIHLYIDLFYYFLFVERIKMKLGDSMLPRLVTFLKLIDRDLDPCILGNRNLRIVIGYSTRSVTNNNA